MGRTLPSASMAFQLEREAFQRFKRGLSPTDQRYLDDLFVMANQHIAVISYAAHPLPFLMALSAMLLEEQRAVVDLRNKAAWVTGEIKDLQDVMRRR